MRMPIGHPLAISSNQTCHPERSEGSAGSPRLHRPTSPTPPAGCLDGLRGVRLCNGLLNALRQIWVPRPCGIGSILKLTLFQNEPATFLLTLLYLHATILYGCPAPARPHLLAAGFALLRIPSVSFMPFARAIPHSTLSAKSFVFCTYAKRFRLPQNCANNSFRICTYRNRASNSFRFCTYKKREGVSRGGAPSPPNSLPDSGKRNGSRRSRQVL